MKKFRITALLLVFVFSLMPMVSFADAWNPVDDKDITDKFWDKNNIKSVNIFINNFVESNVFAYTSASSDSVIIKSVLKHAELNGTGCAIKSNGKTYVKLTKSKFDEVCSRMFSRNVPVEQVPGYDKNTNAIIVSADNYKATVHNFAPLNDVRYNGDGVYTFYFTIYKVDDASKYYSQHEYPMGGIDFKNNSNPVGSGEITAAYKGNGESFNPEDFVVSNINIINNTPEYTNENEGKIFAKDEQYEIIAEEGDENNTTYNNTTNNITNNPPAKSPNILLIVVVIGIILIAVGICVVLIVLVSKKK